MGFCLSAESRSPRASSTPRKSPGKKLGTRSSSFERLHGISGRSILNGSSENASLYTQQGKKGVNQDALIVWENFGSRKDTVFCGVFDGHGPYGHMVAKRVRDYLPLKLSARWEVDIKRNDVLREVHLNADAKVEPSKVETEGSSLSYPEEEARALLDHYEKTVKETEIFQTLKDSFLKAFNAMDRELRTYSTDCFCSGTTAVTLVKQGEDVVIANIGDSRAVLGTRDENYSLTAVQLTVDLKPDLPGEAERIRKRKGRVFSLKEEPEVARVWLPKYDSPGLAMSRAFGDFCLKEFGLISVPEISYRRIADKDEFIVLATDGIWDVLSNDEVVQIVGSVTKRSQAAKTLVQSAVSAWRSNYPTSKIDDCAVVCLFLDSNESFNDSSTELKENVPSLQQEDSARLDDQTV